ncbi:HmuY family protein [Thaumasiovibrio subtropicus]|uniref:HmuY family protein n=1 Tax=Thaumasiovibrio subtropicus TaxID=1891207 RepID=UPI000B351852|nr:HmuY family protein [Thaumasiovibrio subtropicus]
MAFHQVKKTLPLAIAGVLLVGCGSSSNDTPTTPVAPPEGRFDTIEIDASEGESTRVDLASKTAVIDNSWDVAYKKFIGFVTNDKVLGCIAHSYDQLFVDGKPVAEEFKKLTFDNTVDNFNKVTADACKDDEYIGEGIDPRITMLEWLEADYSQGAPTYNAKPGNGWLLRLSNGKTYAKFSVKTVDVVTGANPRRHVVVSTSLWDDTSQQFAAAVDSPILDFTTSRVFFDIDTNKVVTESEGWDISIKHLLRDYIIQVNNGAASTGKAGVGQLQVALDDVTNPKEARQVAHYLADKSAGILSQPGNYGPLQYAVDGGHKMWPTFTTYLIKDTTNGDTRLFKFQVISNYGKSGGEASGNHVYRVEELQAQ